jgi:palmitoyltransferase
MLLFGRIWCIWWDICGALCCLLTWGVVLASNVVVMTDLLPFLEWGRLGVAHAVVYQTTIIMIFASHLRTVFSDPGTIPLPVQDAEDEEIIGTACMHEVRNL